VTWHLVIESYLWHIHPVLDFAKKGECGAAFLGSYPFGYIFIISSVIRLTASSLFTKMIALPISMSRFLLIHTFLYTLSRFSKEKYLAQIPPYALSVQ
jgi:hypothetical protein